MNTVEQLILEHPALKRPQTLLAHYQRTRSDHRAMLRKMTPHLANVKRTAVADGNQDLAKAVWCLETVAEIQRQYLTTFDMLKQSKFYAAWCSLETIDNTLHALKRHFQLSSNEYGLAFIKASTVRWQSLYPYAIFASPEILKREVRCGICDAVVSLRKGCGHRVHEIYDGKCCFRRVTKAEVLGIALVHNPVQKYSVMFQADPAVSGGESNQEAYPLAHYAINGLVSPWDVWAVERTTTRHPHSHFSDVASTDECPCMAPQGTYAQCCLPQEGVLRPHVIIGFSVPPPRKLMKRVYV